MNDNELMRRLDFIEFRQDLLFENSDIARLIYELKVTRDQYRAIMDLMDSYRNKIDSGEKVHHATFEQEMFKYLPEDQRDYHNCETICLCFMEDGRWEEVFRKLYGDLPKYSYLKK